MLKNLKLLLSLRAWLRSANLQAGGAVLAIGQLQMWLATDDGMRLLALAAQLLGMTAETFSGLALSVVGLAMLVLRAKTEKSLAAKVEPPITVETRARLLLAVGFFSTLFALSPQPSQAQAPPVPAPAPLTFETRLTWVPPTTNTDGSPLTNLATYRVYYAVNAAANWSAPIVVSVPNATAYTLTQNVLQPSTLYFFYVTACNSAGVCSAASNVASAQTPSLTRPQPPNGVEVVILFNADLPT